MKDLILFFILNWDNIIKMGLFFGHPTYTLGYFEFSDYFHVASNKSWKMLWGLRSMFKYSKYFECMSSLAWLAWKNYISRHNSNEPLQNSRVYISNQTPNYNQKPNMLWIWPWKLMLDMELSLQIGFGFKHGHKYVQPNCMEVHGSYMCKL